MPPPLLVLYNLNKHVPFAIAFIDTTRHYHSRNYYQLSSYYSTNSLTSLFIKDHETLFKWLRSHRSNTTRSNNYKYSYNLITNITHHTNTKTSSSTDLYFQMASLQQVLHTSRLFKANNILNTVLPRSNSDLCADKRLR